MLSFSTKGSAKSDDVEKVSNAVSLAQEKIKADNLEDIVVDGEFQFDAKSCASSVGLIAQSPKIYC